MTATETQKAALEVIEATRVKAFELSDTDKIGNVVQKYAEMLLSLVTMDDREDGVKRLKDSCESLKSEKSLIYKGDKEKDDSLRGGIYKVMDQAYKSFMFYAEREEKYIAATKKVKKEEPKDAADAASLVAVSDSGVGGSSVGGGVGGSSVGGGVEGEEAEVKLEPLEDNKDGIQKIKGAVNTKDSGKKKIKTEKEDDDEGTKGKGGKRAADGNAKTPAKRGRRSNADKAADAQKEKGGDSPSSKKENNDEIKVVKTVKAEAKKAEGGAKKISDFFKKKN